MNEREWQFLSPRERTLRDGSSLPLGYLAKALAIKLRRRLWGWYVDRDRRLVWTPFAITESEGPELVVRTYLEHAAIRSLLSTLPPLRRACELGCGYGRMTMVLQEAAAVVKGFEREAYLVETARRLMPQIAFEAVPDLALVEDPEPFDLVMTFTVLQHLTDDDARRICARMRRLAPNGYLLVVEKTDAAAAVTQHADGRRFISRPRSVATYEEYLQPFRLISTLPRPVESTHDRPHSAGTLMLFEAPGADARR